MLYPGNSKVNRFILFFALFFLLGCSKSKVQRFSNFEMVNVGDHMDLNHAVFLNDSVGFAGGGKKYHYGYIYKTINGGKSWKKDKLLGFMSVYSFGFLNDTVGYAGCDRLNFEKTVDGGLTWMLIELGGNVPFHFYDRTPIYEYQFLTDSLWMMVGGDLYNKGLFYRTEDGGKNWSFEFFDHELKGLSIAANGVVYISGFGYVGKSVDRGRTFRKLDLSGDFFVGIKSLSNNVVVCVGNNGGIYRSVDGGNSWEKIRKQNGYFKMRRSYNDLKFYGPNTGIAIGNYGLISITQDGGQSWEDIELEGNPHLFSIEIHEDELILSSEDGNVIKLKIASII